jgi:hypothetical protein
LLIFNYIILQSCQNRRIAFHWILVAIGRTFADRYNSISESAHEHRNKIMKIEQKLEAMGLVLPEPIKVPAGVKLPFAFVRVRGNRAYISGHGPQNPDGSVAPPFGKLGEDVTIEQGYEAAKLTALSILGSLKRELGDLDRVTAWLRLFGMVNARPPGRSRWMPCAASTPRGWTAR